MIRTKTWYKYPEGTRNIENHYAEFEWKNYCSFYQRPLTEQERKELSELAEKIGEKNPHYPADVRRHNEWMRKVKAYNERNSTDKSKKSKGKKTKNNKSANKQGTKQPPKQKLKQEPKRTVKQEPKHKPKQEQQAAPRLSEEEILRRKLSSAPRATPYQKSCVHFNKKICEITNDVCTRSSSCLFYKHK